MSVPCALLRINDWLLVDVTADVIIVCELLPGWEGDMAPSIPASTSFGGLQ